MYAWMMMLRRKIKSASVECSGHWRIASCDQSESQLNPFLVRYLISSRGNIESYAAL